MYFHLLQDGGDGHGQEGSRLDGVDLYELKDAEIEDVRRYYTEEELARLRSDSEYETEEAAERDSIEVTVEASEGTVARVEQDGSRVTISIKQDDE